MRWSFTVRRPLTQEQLLASMVMTYHSLEKGLALSHPRSGFGRQKADLRSGASSLWGRVGPNLSPTPGFCFPRDVGQFLIVKEPSTNRQVRMLAGQLVSRSLLLLGLAPEYLSKSRYRPSRYE